MPVTERRIENVIRNMAVGFSSYTLFDLVKAGWCREAKSPADLPEKAHWQILTMDAVTTWSGYKEDSGTRQDIWRLWVFEDEQLWEQAVQFYFDDLTDPDSPNRGPGRDTLKLVALESSGKVIPHVTVGLARDRRG